MLRVFRRAVRLLGRQPARAWLMMRMAGWVLLLSALVKIWSLPRALRLISTNVRREQKRRSFTPDELVTAIDGVLEIERLALKPNCWKRSAVLHRYLALQGVETTIVFGLKKEPEGELKGHAWLETDGVPIVESEPPAYKVTYKFPSAEPFEVELEVMASSSNEQYRNQLQSKPQGAATN